MEFEFMRKKLRARQPPVQGFAHDVNDGPQAENITSDNFPMISCTICGRALSLQIADLLPYEGGVCCDICGKDVVGQVYHCSFCKFDAHEDCAEIKDEVKVDFHDDPLHLLVQNYYHNNPDVNCSFCAEPLQDSEWVYRCEECNFNVHAFCTKLPKKISDHPQHRDDHHILTLIPSPTEKKLFCTCCNGDVKGTYCYTCTQNKCTFVLHSFCAIVSENPLSLLSRQKSFHCRKCGTRGLSWFYHCNSCAVEMYLDCVSDMEEEETNWNVIYEKFMLEHSMATKDDHAKVDMITRLLNKLLVHNMSEASSASSSSASSPSTANSFSRLASSSSSSSRPRRATRRVHSTIQKRTAASWSAIIASRHILKAQMLDVLAKLERIVEDLQSSKSISQANATVLAAALKDLTRRHYINQVDDKAREFRQGPRTGLFHKSSSESMDFLTSLRADMKDVHLTLLCEQPGYHHIVRGSHPRIFNGVLGEPRLQKLQPLLASGLRYIRENRPWHHHVHEESEDDAEESDWFLLDLKNDGIASLKFSGLFPVRFTRTSSGNTSQGSFAWLCDHHFNRGRKCGILEYYPVKRTYHNLDYDQHHQFI